MRRVGLVGQALQSLFESRLAVVARLLQQVGGGARLDQLSPIQHQHPIGPAEGAEAMGDDERGPPFHRPVERFENLLLGLGVDRGGGVIEQQDPRVEQHRPGDGQALALSAREIEAPFPQRRVVPLRELLDELVGTGDAGGPFDVFAGDVGTTEGDVRRNGVAEEKRFLKHNADLPTEGGDVELAEVVTVDEDPPGGGVVEPGDQGEERGLARSGLPQQGDPLPGLNLERQLLQHRRVGLIVERDRVELDRSRESGVGEGLGRRGDFDWCVEDLEHPAGGTETLLHAVGDVGETGDLVGELGEQTGEDDQARAQWQPVLRDQPATVSQQHDHIELGEEANGGGEQADPPEDGLLVLLDGVDRGAEFGDLFGLATEPLDHLHSLNGLGEGQHDAVGEFAGAVVEWPDAAGEERGESPEQRRGGEAGEGDSRVDAEHVGEVADQREQQQHDLDHDAVDERAHRLHVGGDTIHDAAGGVVVEEPEAQPLQPVVDPGPQIDHDLFVNEPARGDGVEVVQPAPHGGRQQNAGRDRRDFRQWSPVRGGPQAKGIQRRVLNGAGVIQHGIDADAGEPEAREAEEEDQPLQGEEPDAAPAVLPREGEQAADEVEVASGERRESRRPDSGGGGGLARRGSAVGGG